MGNQKFKKELNFEITLIALALSLVLIYISYFATNVSSGVGGNVTVITQLDVGNVFPEILIVDINDDSDNLYLNPNTTKLVSCVAVLRDFNEDTDINNVTAEFFDNGNSSYGDLDDNNEHYTNSSCTINKSYDTWGAYPDDIYHALANCTFEVQYYANPGNWNCTVFVNDSVNWNATNSSNITTNELLALGIPNVIHYGTVNATFVSNENITNVSNAGNVMINLSLDGYAINRNDGLAMNCTLGSLKNISIQHEKYNLTGTNGGALTLSQASAVYTNLSSTATVKRFDLNYRQEDGYDDATNATYWRIYVPIGVAGTCQGNIVFGAIKATGT